MAQELTPALVATRGPNAGRSVDSAVFVCPRCRIEKSRATFLFRKDGRPRYCQPCGHDEYMANRAERISKTRKWQQGNPEKNRAKNRAYYEANRQERLAYAREYGKRWQRENRDRAAAGWARRRERLKGVLAIPYTVDQVRERWDYYRGRCWMCGGQATEMDHVKPILHRGPDMLANLRPACDFCNSSKGWKWPVQTHVHGTPFSDLRPVHVTYIPLREITC